MGTSSPIEAFNGWARDRGWDACCDPDLQLENAGLCGLLGVWREAAAGRPAPLREEMTARLLKPYLLDIALMERLAPQSYRVRLMGSHLTRVLGHLQGKLIGEVEPPEVALRWYAVLDLTLAEQRPLRYHSLSAYPGREHLKAEALHLPLSTEAAVPSAMVLMGVIFGPNAV